MNSQSSSIHICATDILLVQPNDPHGDNYHGEETDGILKQGLGWM